jgi:hypothetical protein
VPSTGIKNQPHRFEIVAISSVDEDILASCNVVVVVAGHREIDSSRTEKKHTTELGMLPLMNCAILSLCTTHFVFFFFLDSVPLYKILSVFPHSLTIYMLKDNDGVFFSVWHAKEYI